MLAWLTNEISDLHLGKSRQSKIHFLGGGAMLERWLLLHCHWFLVCARRYVWYSLGGEESEARRGGIMAMLAPHVEAANAALDPLHTRP